MQLEKMFLLLAAFTIVIQGQMGEGIYIADPIDAVLQGQVTGIEFASSISTSDSNSFQIPDLNNMNIMPMSASENIVAAIRSVDEDSIARSIVGANSGDVADAFVNVAEQGGVSSNTLAVFIISVVVTQDSLVLDKIIDAFQIMAQNGECNSIYKIFQDMNTLIDNEMTLAKLVEAFSGSQQVLDCATNASPPGDFVPDQDKCREGTPACQWWQKKSRSLLNQSLQCEVRYVCSYFGFDSKFKCQQECER